MRTRILSAWLVGALPLAVSASEGLGQAAQDVKGAAQVGGLSTIDYVTLRAGNLGAPLRFGHVFQGSEQVQMGGRVLTPGTDYGIDYETGVVYLKRAQRTGDQIVVTYRYDPQGKASTGTSFTGVNSFGLSLAPGLGLVGGIGLTERAADGSVMSNNVFGWNNTLNFGGKTSVGGVYLYSDRKKNDNVAGLSMDPNARPGDASTDQGASQFLLQNFRSALFGGNVSVDYQDISKNFSSAGQVKSAGYSDADVARLMKERGLKRQGMSLTGMKLGQSTIGASFRQVGDPLGGGIDWSSYGFQQGGLKMAMNSQRVDAKFTRFGDLSEADRAQLQKEAGLSRDNMTMEFAQKASKFSFNSTSVKDDTANVGLVRREAKLDTGKIGFDFGDQQIDKSFTRIGSLTGAEQGQWAREIGVKRQWAGLNAALSGPAKGTFAFRQLDLDGTAGDFKSQDASYQGKTWSLQHVALGGSRSGAPITSLQDAEGTAYVKRIAGFFGVPNTNDGQRGQLLAAGDLRRNMTSATGTLGKTSSFSASSLGFGKGKNGGVAQAVDLNTAKVKASFHHQDFGGQFTDATRLMDFERAKLGTVAGLERTDISFGIQVDKNRSFQFGQTQAKDGGGDLDRTTLAYSGKGLTVNAAQRGVSKGFTSAPGMVDPENGLLAQFQGFQERDLGFNYTGTKGLKVQSFVQDAINKDTNEARSVANTDIQWQADKLTGIAYQSQVSTSRDPLTTLFAQSLERLSVTHSFGKLATFKYVDEQVTNDGKNNASPDSHKQYVALETQVTSKTSLKTEQTKTDFSNGDKENISANTVSTALAKNMGVSVTGVSIDRKGDDNDERKTNYGFWYDLGKGLRFNYGFAQSLIGDANGTGTSMMTFGQTPNTLAPNQVGQVGGSNVGGIMLNGGYGENSVMSADPNLTHTQSFANFGLTTAKPFKFGAFTDLKLNLGLDTAADYSQYLRQNQVAGLSGKIGKNVFAVGYRGQLANPNLAPTATSIATPNIEAVDRSIALTTDPSPKAPIVLNGAVKYRTLPDDKDYMSRNFTVTARPAPGIEISNQVQTNLEQANPNVLLGSQLLADRGNKWTMGFKGDGDTSFGASWEEKSNDTTLASSTLSAVNLTLFQKHGSPLKLSYGLDEVEGNVARRQITRYSLQYDAKATATQTFSMYVGNTDYAYNVTDPLLKGDNWMMRLNYQIRF